MKLKTNTIRRLRAEHLNGGGDGLDEGEERAEAQGEEHREEEHRPQLRRRHPGDRLREHDERQTRPVLHHLRGRRICLLS